MQDGQVVLRMAVTGAAAVLIQDKVFCVSYAPVAERRSQEHSSFGGREGIQICRRRLGG